ncbi:DUF423 domain-containing protein [Ketobacter sp.]|uniref:DUF423 domain-containing protein n=1 Tax=Ketobacter sp. TaxID=2083498 RepID=UPI000F13E75B|nr:DUF423 domain-containing protein [Ketobacter sp.]RLT95140.1 MAG: DUF423 domain-containing protein [Ketobacter sp.]
MKIFIVIGLFAMALGVILGAFGAHGLKGKIEPNLLAAYQTGVEYHLYHALGLLLVGLLAFHFPQAAGFKWGSWLLLWGILLFSGSLYLMAFTGLRWLGAITPLGGTAFIVGWVWIAWSVIRSM